MKFNRLFACSALSVVGLLPTIESALATCGGANASGKIWHFHAIEVNKSANSDASAIKCVITFGMPAGHFTGPCISFQVGQASSFSTNVSGTINLTGACDITGSIAIPSNPAVTIRAGHINGTAGSGIGTQSSGANTEVLHFSLIQK